MTRPLVGCQLSKPPNQGPRHSPWRSMLQLQCNTKCLSIVQQWQSVCPYVCDCQSHGCYCYQTADKRRSVAEQTARRSCCIVLSIHHVYYCTAYQRQRILHGVGVITKLYFAISAAFKESMCRGHSRLYIFAAIESPCTTMLIVTFTLSSTILEILSVYMPRANSVSK